MGRTLADGHGRRRDAGLVARGGTRGADAGRHDEGLLAEGAAHGGSLEGGAHNAVGTVVERHAGKQVGLLGDGMLHAHGGKLGGVHAREHRDGEELGCRQTRSGGTLVEALTGGRHHGRTARGMNRHHVDTQAGKHARGALHGVGDVVELEVEEHLETTGLEVAHEVGAAGIEELHADLGPGKLAGKLVGQLIGALLGAVERDDDVIGSL